MGYLLLGKSYNSVFIKLIELGVVCRGPLGSIGVRMGLMSGLAPWSGGDGPVRIGV